MEERREFPRSPMLKPAKAVIARTWIVDCTVRNRSENGACLIVPYQLGVPTEFELAVEAGEPVRPAEVLWRAKNRLGLRLS